MESRNYIKMDQVQMSFQGVPVLNEITLEIKQGEIFGLLGPSGAGKTTLIKILTGQLKQTKGSVNVLGTDGQMQSANHNENMGMVLDNTGLYERLNCYDNLLLFARIYNVSKAEIPLVLQQVGLKDEQKKMVNKLSKGMKQRLAFARAILSKPQILFLDEPTSSLDPVVAKSLHELIRKEKQRGATIVLTTHNMEEATKLCDHVALLNQGEIVEFGTPHEICGRYNHQNKLVIQTKDGEEVTLSNQAESALALADYMSKEQVQSIHSTEPNLETVFIELTGRRLQSV